MIGIEGKKRILDELYSNRVALSPHSGLQHLLITTTY
jgi:hypothetical protein